MPTLQLRDRASLSYTVHGHGAPLVLVHGSATDSTTWEPVIDMLSARHRVITYDRRGYGRSASPPVRDHRVHTRDLAAILGMVGEPAHVVGWSAGGNIALGQAVAHPDSIATLCIVEAPFHGLRHADRSVLAAACRIKYSQLRGRRTAAAENFLRWASRLRQGSNSYDLLDDEHREALVQYADNILAEWDPHPYGIMMEHVDAGAVAGLDLPMTWVLGSDSLPWLHGLAQRVATERPDMLVHVAPGSGHLVHHDNPEAFVRIVEDSIRAGISSR